MALTNNQSDMIAKLASTTTPISSKSKYIPHNKFIVYDNDEGYTRGLFSYENPLFEIGPAIQIKDWIFVIERMTPYYKNILLPNSTHNQWIVGAFNGTTHYTFDTISIRDQNILGDVLVEYILFMFWPILHPNLFKAANQSVTFTYEFKSL
jgi:hypothetical protein